VSSRPTILVSNDDGVDAPGIRVLANALAEIGDVTVVAPDRERSAASHSLTLQVPLRAQRIDDSTVSVDGTPTDCVMLAINNLLSKRPDLVVSGINRGPNMGDDLTYSGTVAAAMEGTLLGIPSIAVSLDRPGDKPYDYHAAGVVARELAAIVLERGLPQSTLLNVNVPHVPLGEIKGIRITRQGKQVYEDLIVEKRDPRGRAYYWIGGQQETWSIEPNTDYTTLAKGYVSVTPVQLDLTDYRTFATLEGWGLDRVIESFGRPDDGVARGRGRAGSDGAEPPEEGSP